MEIDYHFKKSVIVFKPKKFFDERGFFAETYNLKKLKKLGVQTKFIQDNYSFSKLSACSSQAYKSLIWFYLRHSGGSKTRIRFIPFSQNVHFIQKKL